MNPPTRTREQALEADVARLRRELADEERGAQFLAAEVARAWLDGIAEGMRRATLPGAAAFEMSPQEGQTR